MSEQANNPHIPSQSERIWRELTEDGKYSAQAINLITSLAVTHGYKYDIAALEEILFMSTLNQLLDNQNVITTLANTVSVDCNQAVDNQTYDSDNFSLAHIEELIKKTNGIWVTSPIPHLNEPIDEIKTHMMYGLAAVPTRDKRYQVYFHFLQQEDKNVFFEIDEPTLLATIELLQTLHGHTQVITFSEKFNIQELGLAPHEIA